MRREVIGVGGDPGPLHPGQHADQRQLDLVQQPGGSRRSRSSIERVDPSSAMAWACSTTAAAAAASPSSSPSCSPSVERELPGGGLLDGFSSLRR